MWRNPRGTDFDGTETGHSGIGLSIDQRVSIALTLFARYGHPLRDKFEEVRAMRGRGSSVNGEGHAVRSASTANDLLITS